MRQQRTPIDPILYHKLKKIRICENCGASYGIPLEIHHKIPVRTGGTNELSNLMVVCTWCHQKIDSQLPKEKVYRKKEYEAKNLFIPDMEDESL